MVKNIHWSLSNSVYPLELGTSCWDNYIGSDKYFDGAVDQIMIHDRTLTSNEIYNHWQLQY